MLNMWLSTYFWSFVLLRPPRLWFPSIALRVSVRVGRHLRPSAVSLQPTLCCSSTFQVGHRRQSCIFNLGARWKPSPLCVLCTGVQRANAALKRKGCKRAHRAPLAQLNTLIWTRSLESKWMCVSRAGSHSHTAASCVSVHPDILLINVTAFSPCSCTKWLPGSSPAVIRKHI